MLEPYDYWILVGVSERPLYFARWKDALEAVRKFYVWKEADYKLRTDPQ